MRSKKPGLTKKSGPAKNTLFDCGIDDVEHRFVLQVDLARFGQPPTAWIDQDIDGAARRMQWAGGDAAAARAADVVVLTIPFAHHETTLAGLADALQGKILVDATVPLVPPKVSRVQLPPEGSAAKARQVMRW